MSMLNRQQICAELGVSESTIRRLEQNGLPYTPVGSRSHRYDLDECKDWLQANEGAFGPQARTRPEAAWKPSKDFTEAFKKIKLRVYPSEK